MEPLEIKGDDFIPSINFNHLNNSFSIKGESRPENARKFYEPVLKWMDDYFKLKHVLNDTSSNKSTEKTLIIDLDYFNSTSAKLIFDLMEKLKEGKEKYGITFSVDWHFHDQDEDMLDSGKEMEDLTGLKFNYIKK